MAQGRGSKYIARSYKSHLLEKPILEIHFHGLVDEHSGTVRANLSSCAEEINRQARLRADSFLPLHRDIFHATAAAAATLWQVDTWPVNDTFAIFGCGVRYALTSPAPLTILGTPGGKPASA